MFARKAIALGTLEFDAHATVDVAVTAIAVKRTPCRADAGLAFCVVMKVAGPVADVRLQLLFFGHRSRAMAFRRGEARVPFTKEVVGDIAINLLLEQPLDVHFAMKAAVRC